MNGKGLGHLNLEAVYYRTDVMCDRNSSQHMHVATLSIIVNNKTLQAINYVSCNLTVIDGGLSEDFSSNKAYIVNITNPCEPIANMSVCECPMATECENPTNLNITTNAAHKEQLLNTQLMIIVYICIAFYATLS